MQVLKYICLHSWHKGANPFPTRDPFLSCRLQSFQSTGGNRKLIVTQISRQLWRTMIGYNLGSLFKEPMVGNREVYMTRMWEIESSSKIFTRIMFWEINFWKNMNPSKSYFCIWENFPTWKNSFPDMRNCLSGRKWVGSLICIHS